MKIIKKLEKLLKKSMKKSSQRMKTHLKSTTSSLQHGHAELHRQAAQHDVDGCVPDQQQHPLQDAGNVRLEELVLRKGDFDQRLEGCARSLGVGERLLQGPHQGRNDPVARN